MYFDMFHEKIKIFEIFQKFSKKSKFSKNFKKIEIFQKIDFFTKRPISPKNQEFRSKVLFSPKAFIYATAGREPPSWGANRGY